ncbi:B-cell receptor-associated 31 [Brachionus plicatilis]|uniref:Endoplasmic reticulum transmembrane protein n=1 Tax=Brachionus plicatilis TaxID=10195 RepID=A0A3M7QU82_BRAPC|nr:B-cell receptor-associated 31 [Brachionus plicatilis]
MSLQWCIAAGFLYSEIFFVLFLLVPIISPTRWKEIFNSRLIKSVRPKANVFFNFVIVCLIILLLDATRDMIKYSDSETKSTLGKPKEIFVNIEAVKEFRSQRNLYITGMSLFLMFVIRRLVVLLTTTADLIEDLDLTERDNKSLKNELTTVLEAKLRLAKMVPEEQTERPEILKGELSDKEGQVRSRSKTRVKKEE